MQQISNTSTTYFVLIPQIYVICLWFYWEMAFCRIANAAISKVFIYFYTLTIKCIHQITFCIIQPIDRVLVLAHHSENRKAKEIFRIFESWMKRDGVAVVHQPFVENRRRIMTPTVLYECVYHLCFGLKQPNNIIRRPITKSTMLIAVVFLLLNAPYHVSKEDKQWTKKILNHSSPKDTEHYCHLEHKFWVFGRQINPCFKQKSWNLALLSIKRSTGQNKIDITCAVLICITFQSNRTFCMSDNDTSI